MNDQSVTILNKFPNVPRDTLAHYISGIDVELKRYDLCVSPICSDTTATEEYRDQTVTSSEVIQPA